MSKRKDKKKNKIPRYQEHRYLTSDERPLFGPVHSIQETKKDKANKRQSKKRDLKRQMEEIE